MLNHSQFASPTAPRPLRGQSVFLRKLRLINDHPIAFWFPTLLVLVCGLSLTVAASLSGSTDRVGLILGVTLVVSLAAGLTIARLVDGPDSTFQSIEEVESFCRIPVLGAVPIDRVL